MKYKLEDLIDLDKFQELMKEFYNITKIPHGLLNAEGTILSGIGWQDVCTKFHRVDIKSALMCKESDLAVSNMALEGERFVLYKCKNGLMEAAVPIIVEENYMGMLCLGQFLFEEPDLKFFRKQAEMFGYDQDSYMETVSQIPIFTREKVEATMAYFSNLADMLSSMGLNRLRQKETENLLIKANEKLEERVIERTRKLAIANKKLQIDIRRRKIIGRKLKISEEKYRKLVEIMPDAIVVHDKGTIILANHAFSKLVGIERHEDVIGRNIFNFIHPEDRSLALECARYVNVGRTLPLTEQRLISIGGKSIDIEATGTLFPYEGKTAILAVGRDISERKKIKKMQSKIEEERRILNEAREYEKLKTEFFANLSHEFRTPLNLIYSTIQLFEKDLTGRVTRSERSYINKYLKVFKQNTHRLLRLCNNLLDITKIDSGYFELEIKNINIVNVIEDITMSVARYVQRNNIKVIFDTEVEEFIVAVDVNAVERIMLNLLSNAVKFTELGGEIVVEVSTTDKAICISIKDTGIGIPEDKVAMIFDRFRQVNKSIRRNHEGSGIGLSLVKLLMDLHDGDIEVKSKYGMGSEFILKFPIRHVEDDVNIDELAKSLEVIRNNIEVVDIEFSDIYGFNEIG
ncbi:PocR ligand-binding domain-containing protein [Wukongibacter baidiensis]|uniref:PocR ligand-binding domain-containing protein n=1 Tax=Wukongibacter baidiensis TaxID=1723361 RepID=UPI003D7FD7A3